MKLEKFDILEHMYRLLDVLKSLPPQPVLPLIVPAAILTAMCWMRRLWAPEIGEMVWILDLCTIPSIVWLLSSLVRFVSPLFFHSSAKLGFVVTGIAMIAGMWVDQALHDYGIELDGLPPVWSTLVAALVSGISIGFMLSRFPHEEESP